MSQLSFSSPDSSLLVRDALGHYLPASADQILQAARQVVASRVRRGATLSAPERVKEYVVAQLAGYEHEVFAVLFLDAQLRLIEYAEMFRGTVSCTAVHPREVVKQALACNAASVILAHNHPSGSCEPSSADRTLTRCLKETLALIDVRVLDHVIVGGWGATSLAERGEL